MPRGGASPGTRRGAQRPDPHGHRHRQGPRRSRRGRRSSATGRPAGKAAAPWQRCRWPTNCCAASAGCATARRRWRQAQARGQLTRRRAGGPLPGRLPGRPRHPGRTISPSAPPRSTTARWTTRPRYSPSLFWADLERHHPGIARCTCPARSFTTGSSGSAPCPTAGPAATSTPCCYRPLVLPRPAAMVAGRPGPVGAVGGPVPDQRERRPRLCQGDPAPAGPDGTSAPGRWSRYSRGWWRQPSSSSAPRPRYCRLPGYAAGPGIRRGRRPLPADRARRGIQPVRLLVQRLDEPGKRIRCRSRRGERVLDARGHRGTPAHRRADRGTAGADPSQHPPVPGPDRGDGPAAADQPVQDRHRAGHPRRPRAGGRAGPHHPADQGHQRAGARPGPLRHLRAHLRPAAAAPVPAHLPAPPAGHPAHHGPPPAGHAGQAGRHRRHRRHAAAVHPA